MATKNASGPYKLGGGCAHCGIDIHTHVVPSGFPASTRVPVPSHWPSMESAGPCHATVVIGGRPYRTVSDACWVAGRRLEAMDAAGIRIQALSPMPELFGYWMEIGAAVDLVRYTNDTIAALADAGQGRFAGLGGVPLQDLDCAIGELHRLMRMPEFSGVEIGSNVNGVAIGDPQFWPFYAEAEKLGAAVFVHAVRPAGMDRITGPAPLQQVLGYPTDTGLAAASVITGNLMVKFPALRLCFSHGGGTLPSLLPRLEQGAKTFPALQDSIALSPLAQARRFYVDSLVFDPATLVRLVQLFGEDRVIIGTDYPFNFREDDPIGQIEAAFSDAAIREKLAWRNAAAFLSLTEDV